MDDWKGISGENRQTEAQSCTCAWEGCARAGEYRAPKDRSLSSYVMYCLEHVRIYNARWNWHAGSPGRSTTGDEFLSAATWDRPTWKLGARCGGLPDMDDPFGVFSQASARRRAEAEAPPPRRDAETHQALETLKLDWPVTLVEVKARYKVLVKTHHPDANGGDARAEDLMKRINAAYRLLCERLAEPPV